MDITLQARLEIFVSPRGHTVSSLFYGKSCIYHAWSVKTAEF